MVAVVVDGHRAWCRAPANREGYWAIEVSRNGMDFSNDGDVNFREFRMAQLQDPIAQLQGTPFEVRERAGL